MGVGEGSQGHGLDERYAAPRGDEPRSTSERGATGGLLSTWTRATFRPAALYAGADPERRRARPLVFALVIGAFAAFAAMLVQGRFGAAFGALVLSPLTTILGVYFTAALVHFWLLVVRGRNGAFRDTVGAVCYAQAPFVFAAVPLVGGVIGVLWQVAVLGLGLKHAQRTTAARAWLATILGACTPVLLALFLRAGVVEAFKIPSGSMIPTALIGDHIFINKLTYGPLIPWTDTRLFTRLPPERADVMVFKFPENKEQDFIKRVIAVPGDTFEAINGRPVINGWLVPHCHVGPFHYENRTAELFVEYLGDRDYFTLFDTDPDEQRCGGAEDCGAGLACRGGVCGILQGPFKVAPEEVWVLGDNRNNSHDSRSWRGGRGAGVPFENIKGRAMFVWMSFRPGGSVAQDRLFVDVNGRPTLPPGHAELAGAVEKCLRERPPVAQTTPPRR